MKRWYMEVDLGENTKEVMFYTCDVNPIRNYPERFDHTFVDLPNGDDIFEYVDQSDVPDEAVRDDDIRLAVDKLKLDTDYWIVDAYDSLGSHYPAVPDIPGHSNPTSFVGVPREDIVDVYCK